MDEKLAYTLGEMYRLASQYKDDVGKYHLDTVYKIFHFVRDIPYARDIDSCGVIECLKRPGYGVFEGDCDDKAIIAGAALTLINIPWRFVTVSRRSDHEMQHVYLEIFFDRMWKPFDGTYSTNDIFTERTYTSKTIWNNPMRYDNPDMNVSTLEGLGDTPVIVLADIDAVIKKLQDIPIIGAAFKTKTKHEGYDEAVAQQRDVFTRVANIYTGLPADDAKAQMLSMCKSFFDNWISPDLGHRWSNAISSAMVHWSSTPDWDKPDFRCATYISIPLFYFLYLDDVESLERDIKNWFVDPVIKIVWTPLNNYLVAKYGSGLPDSPTGGGTSASAQSTSLGIILLGGLALAFMGGKGRRR